MKNNFKLLSLLGASLLLLLIFTGAFAAAPQALHIEVLEHFNVPDPFVASGDAVDSGLVCASGTVEDISWSTSGSPSAPYRIINVTKRFTCTGGDTFDLSMLVRLDNTTLDTTARWTIFNGTGDLSGLRGNGSLEGTSTIANFEILDVYDGIVH